MQALMRGAAGAAASAYKAASGTNNDVEGKTALEAKHSIDTWSK